MSRKSQSFIYKLVDERIEIDIKIIMDPHGRLTDRDLPSQIGRCCNGHRIAVGATDRLFEIFDLVL